MNIISEDEKSHTNDETCWCNPRICNSENEILIIHNVIKDEERTQYNEIKSNQRN